MRLSIYLFTFLVIFALQDDYDVDISQPDDDDIIQSEPKDDDIQSELLDEIETPKPDVSQSTTRRSGSSRRRAPLVKDRWTTVKVVLRSR